MSTPPPTDRQAPAQMPRGSEPAGSRLSMHAEVEVWCDCCSCEAEPRWRAVEQMCDEAEAAAQRPRMDADER